MDDRRGEDRADLVLDRDVTVALLLDPLDWRVRVVEQIEIDSPNGTTRRRSLQTQPLRPLVAAAARQALGDGSPPGRALLALPVAPVPKGPLVDFDVTGPDGRSALLLPRAEIAARQAVFMSRLADRAGLAVTPGAAVVFEQAFAFTGSPWSEFDGDLDAYLTAGTERPVAPHMPAWRELSARAAACLAPWADVADPDSAVEHPALIVPVLLASGAAEAPAAVTSLLEEYVVLCERVLTVAADDDGPAGAAAVYWLGALVDYGGHYDLMAVMDVPLDEPFLVKTADRRPLVLSRFRNEGRQSVVIADAQSNHVTLRVVDPNGRLAGKVRADTPAGADRAYGVFPATATPQVHSFYAFEDDRDYRVELVFQVATLRRLQLLPYAVAAGLIVLAFLVVREDPADRELALLVGPAALASSILLAREPSALGSRLRVVSTYLLAAAIALLVAVGASLYYLP